MYLIPLLLFNLEYFLSIFLALAAGYSVHRMAPSANSIVKFFVIPLIVAYASLTLFNMVLPKLNKYGDLVGDYVEINGKSVHVITAADRNVRLTTWEMNDHQGRIDIQDYVLICPGVRIDSALSVEVGASGQPAGYDSSPEHARSAPQPSRCDEQH